MRKVVSIAIPVYKRLNTFPQALQSVAAQDYPYLELIVSDNGMNGTKVQEMIAQGYSRPYRFRQNADTVSISIHYNQLIEAASGEYCVILDDDDSLSPNFVSELVSLFEQHPQVAVALAAQEVVDESGQILRRSSDRVPDLLTGEEFIRSWTAYGFECYTAMMAKTREMKRCGGYENFPRGTHADDALLIKLCLNGSVAFGKKSRFRWRISDSSFGWSMSCEDLAEDTRQFLHFLSSDPTILAYAAREPIQWAGLKAFLVNMAWHTYFDRWDSIYKKRLALFPWVKAAFTLPFIPDYYRAVRSSFVGRIKGRLTHQVKSQLPWAYKLYEAFKRPHLEKSD